jgi:hypothetical protein
VNAFEIDDILPAAPGEATVLHDREYRVRAFRLGDDRLLLQGAVRDQKPAGLYFAADPDPLTVHHMQLDIEVAFPGLEIVDARVGFEAHPHSACPTIADHYTELVGLSVTRGFTHRVRELFGGPRGCTHTTALLQAMAPVAVQCFWSMHAATAREAGTHPLADRRRDDSWRRNVNTCHVYDEDGPLVAAFERGASPEIPIFLSRRMEQLGIDPDMPPDVDE